MVEAFASPRIRPSGAQEHSEDKEREGERGIARRLDVCVIWSRAQRASHYRSGGTRFTSRGQAGLK